MNAMESGSHLDGGNTVRPTVRYIAESVAACTCGSAPVMYRTNLNILVFSHPTYYAYTDMGMGHSDLTSEAF